jgi:pimeloyl-ACP methyl ester carboxylesterase
VNRDALLGRPSPRHQPTPPGDPATARSPRPAGLVTEAAGVLQVARLLRAAPWLARAPRAPEDAPAVIDLPGWLAPEASNVAMRTWLRRLGYDVRPWGLGTNRGRPERDARRLVERLDADPDGGPVALLGWSLGGVVAREVARALPDRVTQVITYGTPVVGGPTHTVVARLWGAQEGDRIEQLGRELDRDDPIRAPITAIYTRRDAIVDWRACLDTRSPRVRHVEVRSTHTALGLDPDVWVTVADALAGRLAEV